MSSGIQAEELRVSVATLNRVIFSHPHDGAVMLALERKATVLSETNLRIKSQPFGGAVRILDPKPLRQILGEIRFDNQRSEHEQDFRILIPASKWDLVKTYCLHHLEDPEDPELESLPDRELTEEFEETLGVILKPGQYRVKALATVIENSPIPTENASVPGVPTVRIYRTFEVHILEEALWKIMLEASERYSDQDLGLLARKNFLEGGRGHANSILTLPIHLVTEAYRSFPPELRYRKINIANHTLDQSVLAILEDIDVPQYQKMEAKNG
jgi:hypothetical protein